MTHPYAERRAMRSRPDRTLPRDRLIPSGPYCPGLLPEQGLRGLSRSRVLFTSRPSSRGRPQHANPQETEDDQSRRRPAATAAIDPAHDR